MAKIHMEAGPFGQATCGKVNVDTTKSPGEVTCQRCRGTDAFKRARLEARRARNQKPRTKVKVK